MYYPLVFFALFLQERSGCHAFTTNVNNNVGPNYYSRRSVTSRTFYTKSNWSNWALFSERTRKSASQKVSIDDEDSNNPFFLSFLNKQQDQQILQADNIQYLKADDDIEQSEISENFKKADLAYLIGALALGLYYFSSHHDSFPMNLVFSAQNFLTNPTDALESIVNQVSEMGDLGILYFGIFYTIAEVLAIPAMPLTASAGYLFGVVKGTGVVLTSAAIAASISFWIGRTAFRPWFEKLMEDYPKFKAIDKAVGREGFKLMLLIRISPLFPFAISNYLYGVTNISFPSYFFGTLFGFLPGTVAYVYTGEVGKALTIAGNGDETQPWYVYVGILGILVGAVKIITDIATNIINDIEELEDDDV